MVPLFIFGSYLTTPGSDPGDDDSTTEGGLAVILSINELNGFHAGVGTAVSTPVIILNVSGGIPPYTYSWLQVNGDDEQYVYEESPNRWRFARYFGTAPGNSDTTWRAKVVDSAANEATSGTLLVRLRAGRITYTGGNDEIPLEEP